VTRQYVPTDPSAEFDWERVSNSSNRADSIDHIYDWVEENLLAGRLDRVEAITAQFQFDHEYCVAQALSILTATLPWQRRCNNVLC
jgi:hypothetical protein